MTEKFRLIIFDYLDRVCKTHFAAFLSKQHAFLGRSLPDLVQQTRFKGWAQYKKFNGIFSFFKLMLFLFYFWPSVVNPPYPSPTLRSWWVSETVSLTFPKVLSSFFEHEEIPRERAKKAQGK